MSKVEKLGVWIIIYDMIKSFIHFVMRKTPMSVISLSKNMLSAEVNGFPCDIPLPDPNIYIDDVDSNASVNPELYRDVEVEARHNME